MSFLTNDGGEIMPNQNNTVIFNPKFMELGINMPGALFLSQALSWSQNSEDDGWFTKTMDEWEQATGLSKHQQSYARNKLIKLNILKEKQKGMPRRIYFRIDKNQLKSSLDA